MNKKSITVIICILIILVATGFIIYFINKPAPKNTDAVSSNNSSEEAKKSFTDLAVSDIASIEIYSPGGEKIFYTLTENETEKFVEAMKKVVVFGDGNEDYKNYVGGQWNMFRLTENNGKITEISSANPFIIIDGKGYNEDYDTLDELYSIYKECVSREW